MRVHIATEEHGRHLVSRMEGDRPDFWPTWCVRPDGSVHGPKLLGSWLKFCPSDWYQAKPPYPGAVQAVIDQISER
jgi:hypothetical protein